MASNPLLRGDLTPSAVVFRHDTERPANWPHLILSDDGDVVVSACYNIGASAYQGQWRIRVDIYSPALGKQNSENDKSVGRPRSC